MRVARMEIGLLLLQIFNATLPACERGERTLGDNHKADTLTPFLVRQEQFMGDDLFAAPTEAGDFA